MKWVNVVSWHVINEKQSYKKDSSCFISCPVGRENKCAYFYYPKGN